MDPKESLLGAHSPIPYQAPVRKCVNAYVLVSPFEVDVEPGLLDVRGTRVQFRVHRGNEKNQKRYNVHRDVLVLFSERSRDQSKGRRTESRMDVVWSSEGLGISSTP